MALTGDKTKKGIIHAALQPTFLFNRSTWASGAVSAIVFAYIVIYPLRELGLILIPGLFLPGFIFGILYLFAEHYLSKKQYSNIAHDAHISGSIFGIIFINSAWIWNYKILFLHLIVALSWYLNNNKCIISQIEYKLFNKTFIGDGEKIYVPRIHRYLLYLNFVGGVYFHLMNIRIVIGGETI